MHMALGESVNLEQLSMVLACFSIFLCTLQNIFDSWYVKEVAKQLIVCCVVYQECNKTMLCISVTSYPVLHVYWFSSKISSPLKCQFCPTELDCIALDFPASILVQLFEVSLPPPPISINCNGATLLLHILVACRVRGIILGFGANEKSGYI